VTVALAVSGCSSPSKPDPPPSPPAEPTISCPVPQTIQSLDDKPLNILYGSPTVANGKPPVITKCLPESDSPFQLGETTVTCTATDALQRVSACSFLVTLKAVPRLSVTRFVAFGDSITYGEDGVNPLRSFAPGVFHQPIRVPGAQQYPSVLLKALQVRYTVQSPTVVNAGCPGEYAGIPPGNSFEGETAAQRFSDVLSGRSTCDPFNTPRGGPYDVALLMEPMISSTRIVWPFSPPSPIFG
jgi:hypothetical protein